MPLKELQSTVYASLFAALIACGAYLAIPIPISPVPIVLQNLFVLLAGLLLGGRWGLASVGIYLLAGAVGLPVFTGGKGGVAHFFGPTGGYLVGFAASVFVAGLIAHPAIAVSIKPRCTTIQAVLFFTTKRSRTDKFLLKVQLEIIIVAALP